MSLFDSRYESIRTLGTGGSGTVYLVKDRLNPERPVALKCFLPTVSPQAVSREYVLLKSLFHPFIAQACAQGQLEDGRAYLVSEYVNGGDFISYARGLPWKRQLELLIALALTLDFIHGQGIVHLDLKPSNILVPAAATSKTPALKLIDFGMSRFFTKKSAAHAAGTLHYMAPEQLTRGACDERTDLYAVGIIAYELVYGSLPFKTSSADAIIHFHLYEDIRYPVKKRVPHFIDALITACLAKSPQDRFPSAIEIAKFIAKHASLAIDLSAYGPLGPTYRQGLLSATEESLRSIETRLSKPHGPVPAAAWSEELARLERLQTALEALPRPSTAENQLKRTLAEQRLRILLESGQYEAVLKNTLATATARNTQGLAHFYLGHYGDAAQTFTDVLKKAPTALEKGSALNYLGMTAFNQEHYDAARDYWQKSRTVFERIGDAQPLLSVTMNLGALAQQTESYRDACLFYEESLTLSRKLSHPYLTATLLNNLANLYLRFADIKKATLFLQESESIAQQYDIPFLQAYARLIAGDIDLFHRRYEKAETAYQAAYSQFQALKLAREAAIAQSNLFSLAIVKEDLDSARRYAKTTAQKSELDLFLGKRRSVAEETTVELLLAQAHCFAYHGDRSRAAEKAQQAYQRYLAFREQIPFEYRESLGAHPLWACVLAMKDRYHEEDPVKLANFKKLLDINKKMNTEHRLSVLLDYIMDAVIEMTGAERGFLILTSKRKAADFQVSVARNLDQETIQKPAFKVSRSIVGKVLSQGKPILTTDAANDPRLREAKSIQTLKLKSILAVPLLHRGRALGAIYIENRFQQGLFSEDHLELLTVFADQAAIAITNARLSEENQAHLEKIDALNDELKTVLARQTLTLESVTQKLEKTQRSLEWRYSYKNIIGTSSAMEKVFVLLDRVTDREISVLITGESGTGKELVASALHYNSPRKAHEFVAVNCAAIPSHLLESELFGYVRGAFTGAERDKAGLFEIAHRGTLFLDEIGDMPLEMQAKLLRAIQEREIRRLGSHRKIPLDVRIVSATNKPLLALAKKKQFREDLYYRLNGVHIALPPLRERPEDIPLLVQFFIKKFVPSDTVSVSPAALTLLTHYPWPGNIRELSNEIERALTLSKDTIDVDALSETVLAASGFADEPSPGAMRESRKHYERTLILKAVREAGGNKTRAARALGISRVALYQKLKTLEVSLA